MIFLCYDITMEKMANILNCRIDLYDLNEVLKQADNALEKKNNLQIITINPEMIINASKNSDFKAIVNNSDLNIADGVGVKIALKLKGININQIRGIDLSRNLINLAAQKNYKVAFLGAKEEVINKTVENFKQKYTNLNVVYQRNGYFDNIDIILDEIEKACPQLLLVGLGSPLQEEVIVKLNKRLNGCVMIGVGGSFDVFSGLKKESPVIFQKLGLEWLYRTLKEPKRLKRIFPTLPLFLIKCIMEKNKEE